MFAQSGVKVELLCDACERFFNDTYEKPFMAFWSSANALPDELLQDRVLVRAPDPKLVKLFILSVVWRAAAAGSRMPEWEPVKIPTHMDRIRRMLLAKDAGAESDYPIGAFAMVHEEQVLRALIGSPVTETRGGVQIVDLVFGGCLWRTHCAPPGVDVRVSPSDFLQYIGDFWIHRLTACDYPPLMHSMVMDAARQK